MLPPCAQAISAQLDAAFVRIWTLSKDERSLEQQASAGTDPGVDEAQSTVPLGHLAVGRIAVERTPQCATELAGRHGTIAFAGYPLLLGTRLVGVIGVYTRPPIPSAALETVASVADTLALGILQKQAAAAVRKSFSDGQRLSHTGSWAFMVATQELLWSEEHCRLLGYDPVTTKPSLELFWQRVHPEDLPGMQQDFDQALATQHGVDREFRVVLPDGTTKWLHGMDQAVIDDHGRLIEFVGTTMDVSDRKQTEAALYAARAELARVTRMTTMGEFAASVAHEVNQPLAAVLANANACHRWLAREVPDVAQARAAAQRVIKDGKRAGDVIAGMRALFKKSPLELGPVDVAQVIRQVLDAMRPELMRQRIQLRKSLAADLPTVEGDGVQLQQVILNLITNGIQAMSGVTDRARELAVTLDRGDLDGAAGVQVSVQDAGVGFVPEDENKLFDAFYTTKSDGLGMGLAISRSIIEALGGRLWASANPGRGATFRFVLPVRAS